MSHTSTIGKSAEEYAKQYLQRQGLTLMGQNYRCKYGEIDLIMQDKKTTVFVEVRFRKSQRFGSGASLRRKPWTTTNSANYWPLPRIFCKATQTRRNGPAVSMSYR